MDSELEPGPELLQPSHPLCSANKQIQPRPEFHLDPSIDKNMESRSLKPFGWMTAALQHRSLAEPVSAATMLPPAALSTQQPAHHSLLSRYADLVFTQPAVDWSATRQRTWLCRYYGKSTKYLHSIYSVSTQYLHSKWVHICMQSPWAQSQLPSSGVGDKGGNNWVCLLCWAGLLCLPATQPHLNSLSCVSLGSPIEISIAIIISNES